MCETAPGSYYYRGERLSDGAQLQLANAVPAGGGFDAVNPADGSRYQVRPNQLTISSSRATESDPALEYGTRTHHSNMDLYERVQPDDMKWNAAVVASFAWQAAQRDEKLPRPADPGPLAGRGGRGAVP